MSQVSANGLTIPSDGKIVVVGSYAEDAALRIAHDCVDRQPRLPPRLIGR